MLVHRPVALVCVPQLCTVMLWLSQWVTIPSIPALPNSCTACDMCWSSCSCPYCQFSTVCMQIDIRWVNWDDPQTLMPLHDFCQFQHLLQLSGCSWSSRLKYLMLCRAAIVFPSSPYLEFWYRALTPGKNVLIAPEILAPDSGLQLVKIAEQLIKDEPLAFRYATLLALYMLCAPICYQSSCCSCLHGLAACALLHANLGHHYI